MTFASMVCAQFQFFEQMFGGHHQQQRPTSGGAGQWAAQSEAISCSHYLCPDTLVCVSEPSHCPCPDVQDIKCLIPDAEDKGAATVLLRLIYRKVRITSLFP
ncbi:Long chronological lifespan protein 2 [Grifola frondosa]|uniref:Long chronological lifespan protein 2 n=1 Tax=Grifola frondosa TaxID=5627 RepID=A0A1C7MMM6_GRIFR|nr:Long chronological lifespan protein 2 [Grifola frondosa]